MPWGSEIEAMIKEVRDQDMIERTDCPLCGWSLEKLKDGTLHCPYDGWTSGHTTRVEL